MGHAVSYRTVGRLLKTPSYSLQSNPKTLEGASHLDRDAQFQYINHRSKEQLASGCSVLRVDGSMVRISRGLLDSRMSM